jgi:hypothetical protein
MPRVAGRFGVNVASPLNRKAKPAAFIGVPELTIAEPRKDARIHFATGTIVPKSSDGRGCDVGTLGDPALAEGIRCFAVDLRLS